MSRRRRDGMRRDHGTLKKPHGTASRLPKLEGGTCVGYLTSSGLWAREVPTMMKPVSLITYLDFVKCSGSARLHQPTEARKMYEDSQRNPFAFYGEVRKVIQSEYLNLPGLRAAVENLVDRAKRHGSDRAWRGRARAYRAVGDGIVDFRSRNPVVSVASAPSGHWTHGDVRISVNPHMLITRSNGSQEIWFLYFKEAPLSQATANAPLIVMSEVFANAGIDIPVAVVDVRAVRRYVLRSDANRAALLVHAKAEAEIFSRLWDEAAAA